MENEKKLKVLIVYENFIQSFLADAATFGFLAITAWINYTFIGNSKFVNVIILIMFMIFIITKSKTKKFYSKKDAIKYLTDNK